MQRLNTGMQIFIFKSVAVMSDPVRIKIDNQPHSHLPGKKSLSLGHASKNEPNEIISFSLKKIFSKVFLGKLSQCQVPFDVSMPRK